MTTKTDLMSTHSQFCKNTGATNLLVGFVTMEVHAFSLGLSVTMESKPHYCWVSAQP